MFGDAGSGYAEFETGDMTLALFGPKRTLQALVRNLCPVGGVIVLRWSCDWVRVDLGSAHAELSRDGQASTGMPLHEFERTGVDNIDVEYDAVMDQQSSTQERTNNSGMTASQVPPI